MSTRSNVIKQSQKDVFATPTRRRVQLSADSSLPTSAELLAWTLTADAVAPCFVSDVYSLMECKSKDGDFFWLGRVPCRNVTLVGMVVGVQAWEKRTVYTVDDGTAVIDCFHRHTPVPVTPKKRGSSKLKLARSPSPVCLPPLPLACVGDLVTVVGKVTPWRDSAQITVDRLEPCLSSNDEPWHWRNVIALHKSSYDVDGPFTIPPRSTTSDAPLITSMSTPAPTVLSPSSSILTNTPSMALSSPTKAIPQSPPRLRHPSRLHSRDLTENTFRIYLKHYLDTVHAVTITQHTADNESNFEDEFESSREDLRTPTKRSKAALESSALISPYSARAGASSQRTPRAQANGDNFQACLHPAIRGFTLSYLRRVPELADMARRVVSAEKKRRDREARKKEKAVEEKAPLISVSTDPHSSLSTSRASGPSLASSHAKRNDAREQTAQKVKRLFGWAIRKLYEEGSIILWDGPAHRWDNIPSTTGLWTSRGGTNRNVDGPGQSTLASISTLSSNATFSTINSAIRSTSHAALECESDEPLSDPPPSSTEESYIPLTPALLADRVEAAIRALIHSATNAPRKGVHGRHVLSVLGPTKEEIVGWLHRGDARWTHVGVWAVEDALEVLRKDNRAYGVGKGRWELCA